LIWSRGLSGGNWIKEDYWVLWIEKKTRKKEEMYNG